MKTMYAELLNDDANTLTCYEVDTYDDWPFTFVIMPPTRQTVYAVYRMLRGSQDNSSVAKVTLHVRQNDHGEYYASNVHIDGRYVGRVDAVDYATVVEHGAIEHKEHKHNVYTLYTFVKVIECRLPGLLKYGIKSYKPERKRRRGYISWAI